MDESFDASVTQWIDDLKQGDDAAAHQLWDRYFSRLLSFAQRKLGSSTKRLADEEDVVLNAFHALFRGASAGRFEQLTNRDDLWRLLVAITAKEAVTQMRHAGRLKRGGGQVRGESIFGRPDDSIPAGFDQVLISEPTPEFLAMMQEEHERLLGLLRDDKVRQVALLRMQGYSNEEIGQQLDMVSPLG